MARYSLEVFSAVLRASDVRELEFRERYLAQASSAIPQWAASHARDTFAGWEVDFETYGGTIFVGFTGNQDSQIAALRKEAGLIAPGRIEPLPSTPVHSLAELRRLQGEVVALFTNASNGAGQELVISIGVSVINNRVRVRSSHVAKLDALLDEEFGIGAPIEVVFSKVVDLESRSS